MEWCIREHAIEIFPHPNADALELGNIGGYQVVVPKGKYKTGDTVLFLPEKTVIQEGPKWAWADNFRPHMRRNVRVGPVRLRGELSQGIILNREDLPEHVQEAMNTWTLEEQAEGLASLLEVFKFEPDIPVQLRGRWKPWSPPPGTTPIYHSTLNRHDCSHFNLFIEKFKEETDFLVTEKVHGSQVVMVAFPEGHCVVSSKGVFARGYTLAEEAENTYWQGVRNSRIFEKLQELYPNKLVQAFGELVPVQKGYSYGAERPRVILFDVQVDGASLRPEELPEALQDLWVPIVHKGPASPEELRNMAKGMEMVSGVQKHIREGVVVRPMTMGGPIPPHLKIINPKYKESGEEIS